MSSILSSRAWAIFLLVVAADVLDLLSITVTNAAAPTIVRDLGASWSPAPRLVTFRIGQGAFGGLLIPQGFVLLERSLFGNRGFVAGLVFGALLFSTVTAAASPPTCASSSRSACCCSPWESSV